MWDIHISQVPYDEFNSLPSSLQQTSIFYQIIKSRIYLVPQPSWYNHSFLPYSKSLAQTSLFFLIPVLQQHTRSRKDIWFRNAVKIQDLLHYIYFIYSNLGSLQISSCTLWNHVVTYFSPVSRVFFLKLSLILKLTGGLSATLARHATKS